MGASVKRAHPFSRPGRGRDRDLVLLRSQGRATTQADDCQEFERGGVSKMQIPRGHAALKR